MGKRDALLRRNNPIVTDESSDNIIDTIVAQASEEIEKTTASIEEKNVETIKTSIVEPISEPVQKEPKQTKVDVEEDKKPQINPNFKFANKKTQKKTVHKSFVISEELNRKYIELAASTGHNENELFTSILEQLFNVEN